MQHSIWRSPSSDHLTDLLHWPQSPPPATPTPPKVILLFVPGNPGLPHYYIPFLEAIQRALPPSTCAVYALGHLGHSPSTPRIWTGTGAVGLRGQVEDKVRMVDRLEGEWGVGKEGGPRLVVMGHSVGGWVICEVSGEDSGGGGGSAKGEGGESARRAERTGTTAPPGSATDTRPLRYFDILQMLKLRPHLIHSAHLLFPTISHMATSPNGLRMSPLFSPALSPPFSLLTSALSLVPSRLLTPLVALAANQRAAPAAAGVTTSLVQSPGTVVAAYALARDEMATIREVDEGVLKEFGGRMRWDWAKGEEDGWVAGESVGEIERVLDGAGYAKERRVRCEEGMVHAFVLTDSKREAHGASAARLRLGIADRVLSLRAQVTSPRLRCGALAGYAKTAT